MIYLATPYYHRYPEVRQERYETAMRIVYWHLRNGIYLYSPILYCHPMSIDYKLPRGAAFWEKFDHSFIYPASAVWFFLGKGWKHSKGMKREYATAIEWNKEIYTVEELGLSFARKRPLRSLY